MMMVLPKCLPTLQQLNAGIWTHPDNVFCTEHTKDSFISCNTNMAPNQLVILCDKHIPILSTLKLEIPHAQNKSNRNFHNIDWEEFNKSLLPRLGQMGPPCTITTQAEFGRAASNLTRAIQETIKEVVPLSKPSPHLKQWWNHDLALMRHKVVKLNYES
ncbi:hypothetical protein PAXRUDRAFT_161154 [Paxillus rubicundulus Ve08.2h10]|uniref:Uncharacterized protein n=1 Tax=Paxillus rubicundulus Ve08.2h10 TaxID=930991 RepID=A0A0D0CVP0_9AGAM|nr:hypothetical protein PAXRUDRAFT_161154 [Paxillus rubicundulus Ve08.2h10]